MTFSPKGKVAVAFLLLGITLYFFIAAWGVNADARIAPIFVTSVILIILIALLWNEVKGLKDDRQQVAEQQSANEPQQVNEDQAVSETDDSSPSTPVIEGEEKQLTKKEYRKIGILIAWMVVTTLLLNVVSYIYAVPVMLFILTYFINKNSLKSSLWSTGVMFVFFYVIFKVVLHVN